MPITPKQEKEIRLFLSRVVSWPEPGEEAYINFHTTWKPKGWKEGDRLPWSDRNSAFVQDIDTAVNALFTLVDSKDVCDIYIALGTQWHTKPELDKNKQPTGRTVVHRSKENTLRNITFRIDVDIYKGYETELKAQAAISKFVIDAGLPEPSVMVNSGGGYHVYWVLDKPVGNDKWQLIADTLNVATQELGLKVDTAVTVDRSRVLRVPHTFNCKKEERRKVTPFLLDGPTYTIDQIEQSLLKYRGMVKVTSNVTIDISSLAGLKPAFGAVDDDLAALAAGYKSAQYDQIDLKDVYKECGFLGDALRTGGEKIDDNDQWNMLVLLSTFTKQGVKAAHAMSEKWPHYVAGNVDKKYEEKVRYVADSGVGWPKCSTIAKYGSAPCKSCKHLAADKHPFNFATIPPQSFITMEAPNTDYDEVMPNLELFRRDTVTGFWEAKHEDPKGREIWITALKTWVGNAHMSLHGDAVMFVQARRLSGRLIDIAVPAQDLSGNGETLAKLLFRHGVIVNHNMKTKELFVSWMERLMNNRDTQSEHGPYGWATDSNGQVIGFAYNKLLYTKEDKPERVSSGDPQIHDKYTTMGSLEEWCTAAKGVTDISRPAIDAILASQFAAPLAKFVGENVFLNIYSPGSGAGKSTAMHVAQAVWGDPTAIHGLKDTETALFITAGNLRNLPLNWDEIKGTEAKKKIGDIVFMLGQGTEKSRSNTDIKLRHRGSWQTMMVTASNETLQAAITDATRGSEAAFMRVFELEAPVLPEVLISKGNKIKAIAQTNYGKAGEKYAQWLGANYDQIQTDVKETQDRFQRVLKIDAVERFWLAIAVMLDLGAKYANELGLTTINREALHKAITERIHEMREVRIAEPLSSNEPTLASALVNMFLLEKRRFVLNTNKIRTTKNGPKNDVQAILPDGIKLADFSRDTLVAQIGHDDGKLRLHKTAFKEYLEKQGYNSGEIINTLKNAFGASIYNKGSFAAGLQIKSGDQIYVIDIQYDTYIEFQQLADLDRKTGANVVPISKATGFTP